MSAAHLPRRDFLRTAAAVAGATALPAIFPVRAARAIEPVERAFGPKFKFSLAAYSYRNLLKGESAELTIEDFVRDCAKFQLDGTEITSYYLPEQPTDDYLRQLRHLAFQLGLDVSGTAVRNDFCLPPGEKRDQQIAYMKRWVEHAAVLGAPVIRIFSGNTGKGQTLEEAHRLAVEGMQECCDYAGRYGVTLALENHGGLTTTIDGILALLRDVKSPWFAANLDSGNFHGADPYEELAQLAPYAMNVQVKVAVRPANGKSQPVDLKRLADIMRTANYRGYIVLEYEEAKNPRTECPRWIERIREAFTT